jgi:hypothetical protein
VGLKAKLTEILEEMKRWSGPDQDPEGAHSIADDLLIDTIKLLNTGLHTYKRTEFMECQAIINQIMEEYENVEKWFA